MNRRLSVFFISVALLFLAGGNCFSFAVYKKSATASFYAEDFHGKKTSNGEIFNMWAMTCAHKMLPFNTILKVTNLTNGKVVEVRVNDRGPFVGTREIDLSKGAAAKIGMIGAGTAKVKLEIVKLGPYTKASVVTGKKACAKAGIKYVQVRLKDVKTKSDSQIISEGKSENEITGLIPQEKIDKIKRVKRDEGKSWDIQVGAFSKRDNALAYAKKVKASGFSNVILQKTSSVVRVVLKNVESEQVNTRIDELVKKGYYDLVVRERK